MKAAAMLPPIEALGGFIILDCLRDLFTAASKPLFSQGEILVILDRIKNDPEIFDPDVLEAYEQATRDLEEIENS